MSSSNIRALENFLMRFSDEENIRKITKEDGNRERTGCLISENCRAGWQPLSNTSHVLATVRVLFWSIHCKQEFTVSQSKNMLEPCVVSINPRSGARLHSVPFADSPRDCQWRQKLKPPKFTFLDTRLTSPKWCHIGSARTWKARIGTCGTLALTGSYNRKLWESSDFGPSNKTRSLLCIRELTRESAFEKQNENAPKCCPTGKDIVLGLMQHSPEIMTMKSLCLECQFSKFLSR